MLSKFEIKGQGNSEAKCTVAAEGCDRLTAVRTNVWIYTSLFTKMVAPKEKRKKYVNVGRHTFPRRGN